MKRYGITTNFIDESDKETTADVMRNIKHITGDDQPVILNKALRKYYQYVQRIKGKMEG